MAGSREEVVMGDSEGRDWAAGQAPGWLLRMLERLQAIEATEVDAALNAASQLVAEGFQADKVDVFLFDPTSETLVAVGTSDTPMGRRQHAIGLHRLPLANGGRTAEVFQSGRSFRDGRVDRDPDELVGVKEGLGVRSTIAAPFVVNGERRGVLQATSARPDFFGDQDLRFLEVVARWVGLLTERAEQGRASAAEERITVLAHDLRNLLVPLQGRLQLLQRRAEREDRARDVRDVQIATGSLERLTRLIEDLLDVGRLDRGLFAVEPRPTDLVVLARETAGALGTAATRIQIEAPDELVICADPNRLRQALENLLSNAVKHSPDGAPIALALTTETRADDRWALLSVADRGPGIAAEALPRLFTRFAAGPDSSGLGLGLYLARGIAVAHGGTLAVDSRPGQGARFTLALPAEGAPGAADCAAG